MFGEESNYKCHNDIWILGQRIMDYELDASSNGYFDKFAFNFDNFDCFPSIFVIFIITKSS